MNVVVFYDFSFIPSNVLLEIFSPGLPPLSTWHDHQIFWVRRETYVLFDGKSREKLFWSVVEYKKEEAKKSSS